MSTNNQLTPEQLEDLLKKYDTVKPFNRSLFLWLTSAIAILRLRGYNESIQQVEKTTDIAKHLLFIGFNFLLSVLIGFLITPVCSWLFNKFCTKNPKVKHEEQERTEPNPLPQHTQKEEASDKQLKTPTTNPKQDQNKKRAKKQTSKNR